MENIDVSVSMAILSLRHPRAVPCATSLNGVYSTLVLVWRRSADIGNARSIAYGVLFETAGILTRLGTSRILSGQVKPRLRKG